MEDQNKVRICATCGTRRAGHYDLCPHCLCGIAYEETTPSPLCYFKFVIWTGPVGILSIADRFRREEIVCANSVQVDVGTERVFLTWVDEDRTAAEQAIEKLVQRAFPMSGYQARCFSVFDQKHSLIGG